MGRILMLHYALFYLILTCTNNSVTFLVILCLDVLWHKSRANDLSVRCSLGEFERLFVGSTQGGVLLRPSLLLHGFTVL